MCKGSFCLLMTPGVAVTLGFNPVNFGSRMAAMALLFSRFRILKVVVKVIPPISTGTTPILNAVGVLDDTGSSVDAPTTYAGILQLRTSLMFGSGETIPQEFQWNPVDPNLWYHTDSEGSGGDSRWQYPGVLYWQNAASVNVLSQVFFTVEFAGASISS